jgi:hypothetical protein
VRVDITDPEENTVEHLHENVVNSRYVLWTIDMFYFPYIPPNDAPKFMDMIKSNFIMYLGETQSYSTGRPSSDTKSLEISWTPKSLKSFMKYQTDKDTLDTVFSFNPVE